MSIATLPGPRVVRPGSAAAPGWAHHVGADLAWSLSRWSGWAPGLLLNLALALGWLVVDPITPVGQQDLAILLGSYLAVFVLADVSTTNVLGADAVRVGRALRSGAALRDVLLVKNATLLLVAGLPVLALTAALTILREDPSRLAVTLPSVLLPILVWLGIGNLVSVLHPVAAAPLRRRWTERRDHRGTLAWLLALALPYALCVLLDPITDLAETLTTATSVVTAGGAAPTATLLLGLGVIAWGGTTAVAVRLARRRGPAGRLQRLTADRSVATSVRSKVAGPPSANATTPVLPALG